MAECLSSMHKALDSINVTREKNLWGGETLKSVLKISPTNFSFHPWIFREASISMVHFWLTHFFYTYRDLLENTSSLLQLFINVDLAIVFLGYN